MAAMVTMMPKLRKLIVDNRGGAVLRCRVLPEWVHAARPGRTAMTCRCRLWSVLIGEHCVPYSRSSLAGWVPGARARDDHRPGRGSGGRVGLPTGGVC